MAAPQPSRLVEAGQQLNSRTYDPVAQGYDRYQKKEKLGEGTFGVVYRAIDRLSGDMVALKKVRVDAWEEGMPATALREISVLKEIEHENIVGLRDVYVSLSGNLYLVFELLDLDLKKYMDRIGERHMDPSLVKCYLHQMLSGAEVCHAYRFIHRDLKPQNILIARDGRLKLADFGLARVYNAPLGAYTHEVVTLWYRAPEILLGAKTYSTAIDIWSAGCIFAEMITGRPLFPGDSEIDELHRIFRVLGTPNESTWPGVTSLPDFSPTFPTWRPGSLARYVRGLCPKGLDLLARMLVLDPSRRITAIDALQHEYFADLPECYRQRQRAGDFGTEKMASRTVLAMAVAHSDVKGGDSARDCAAGVPAVPVTTKAGAHAEGMVQPRNDAYPATVAAPGGDAVAAPVGDAIGVTSDHLLAAADEVMMMDNNSRLSMR